MDEEQAIRKLEDVVEIMTDMAHIRRSSHSGPSSVTKMLPEISPTLVQEVIEGFSLFDKHNQNGLDIHELATVFRALGQNPTDAELHEIMRNYDVNRDGVIQKEDFEQMILSYMKPMVQVQEELRDAFRIFDKDGSGFIDKTELESVLKKYGEPLTHHESKELIDLMDKNGDGKVDMDEFVNFLCEVDRPNFFLTHYPHHVKLNVTDETKKT